MINLKIREKLPLGSIIFDNAAYDNSIIGTTLDGRVIYELTLMVDEYMIENGCCEEDAIEWIEYNTMRALPYFGDKTPIIVSLV